MSSVRPKIDMSREKRKEMFAKALVVNRLALKKSGFTRY